MSGNTPGRRNWTRSLSVVMVLSGVTVIIGYVVGAGAVKTDRVYLRNTAGAVLFDHGVHKQVVDSCVECHHDLSGEKEEATSCRKCHPGAQPSNTVTIACIECHEDDYTPDMMEHDEYLEIEEHSCQGCHEPRSVSDAYHTNCSSCHLETSPEKFTQANGELLCGACHLR